MPRPADLPAVASSALQPIQVQEKRGISPSLAAADAAEADASQPGAESALEQPLLLPPPLAASAQPLPSHSSPASLALPLPLPLLHPLLHPPPLLLPTPRSPRPSVTHAISASSIALSSSSSASSASRLSESPSPSPSCPAPLPLSLSLRSGHFSMQGLRSEMEDKTVLLPHPLFNSTGQMQDSADSDPTSQSSTAMEATSAPSTAVNMSI